MKHQDIQNEFLVSSKQCELSDAIVSIAKSIEGSEFEFVVNLLAWLNKHVKYSRLGPEEKNKIFRKRTAIEIINEGYGSGCTDFALVFIAIARAKGIPTKYVEVISKDYFSDSDLNRVRGHVFAECYLNDSWYGVDPMAGLLKFNCKYPGYVIYARGLDSWDLEIFDMDSMREKFKDFAEKYNSKK
jgi:transglutaminase-like putative cysteine protease